LVQRGNFENRCFKTWKRLIYVYLFPNFPKLFAVAVVIIWGFSGIAGGWHYSWIAMLVAVVVAGIIKIIGRKDD
jgi:hypothetical protein